MPSTLLGPSKPGNLDPRESTMESLLHRGEVVSIVHTISQFTRVILSENKVVTC